MSKKGVWAVLTLAVVGAVVLVSGCAPKEAELGTEENPIVWVFVPSGEMERVAAGAQDVADLLHDETGLFFDTSVATEYAGAIEGMCADPAEAHMASLATFAYVLASDRGCAEAALLSVRFGSATYNGQILVRGDSGITELADLAGKTFCRTDPLSASGWVVPSIMLRGAGVDPDTDLAEVVDTGSHEAAAAAVFEGTCDAAATFVDARTYIEEDFPTIMEETVVIAIEPDIPNDGVQFIPSLPEDLRSTIVDGLLAIAQTEEGLEALNASYQWEELTSADDTSYDPFRQVLQAAGVSAEDLMGD